jgi:MoaA/NifB/PqqE/SkfB family radical SAM enzyme
MSQIWENIFGLPDTEFIEALYLNLLGREVDPGGRAHYLQMLRERGVGRRQIVRFIKSSTEYRLRHAKTEVPALVEKNLRLLEREIQEKKTVLTAFPRIFNLDLIGVCNMRPPCAMCTLWENETGPRYHRGLTAEDVRAFGDPIRLAAEVINCSIGEPLILKDLIPILELFAEWEKPIGLNSNGLALTPALTEKLVPFFEYLTIIFSIDAATSETYARVRGPHFTRVIENIAYYCRRRREVHPEGTVARTGIVMMPMRVNRHELSDFVRLGARLDADVVELRALNQIDHERRVEKAGYRFDYRQEMLSQAELDECNREARQTARECGVLLDVQYQVTAENTFSAFVREEDQGSEVKCYQPWHFILPCQSGDTFGCCYMDQSLGDWRREGLTHLINHPRMQKMRREMGAGAIPQECRNYPSCPVVQAYGGGITPAANTPAVLLKWRRLAKRIRRLAGRVKRSLFQAE